MAGQPESAAGPEPGVAEIRRARWAILAAAFINGAVFGAWVPLIPTVQGTLGLSAGSLGLALLAVGLGVALLLNQPVAALVGFALVGLALANIVPIVFSAAGRTPRVAPGAAIAAVSTASYLGFLAGPPVIGLSADHITLRGALVLVAGLGVLIAVLAPAVAQATPTWLPPV